MAIQPHREIRLRDGRALACGVALPDRVRAVGLVGALAPTDAPGLSTALSGPLRMMFALARRAPIVLRGMYRLNLRAIASGGDRSAKRMAAWAPEPDRTLLRQLAPFRTAARPFTPMRRTCPCRCDIRKRFLERWPLTSHRRNP